VVVVLMLIDAREVFCLKLISLNRISRSMSPCTRWRPRIIYVFHCKSFRTFVLYTTAFFFCGSHAGCSRDQYNKFFAPLRGGTDLIRIIYVQIYRGYNDIPKYIPIWWQRPNFWTHSFSHRAIIISPRRFCRKLLKSRF